MPITRKPKPSASQPPEIDVDALINRGGSIASLRHEEQPQEAESRKRTAVVNLRIPSALLERIDEMLENRTLKTPRHTWILQALIEKLESEEATSR